MNRIIALSILIFSFNNLSYAEEQSLYYITLDSKNVKIISASEKETVPPEPEAVDPPFWTVKGANIAGKYLTFKGVSTSKDYTCLTANFGQNSYIGNPNGYKSINPNIINASGCYNTSEYLTNPEFLLPTSGKYYFELNMTSFGYANILYFSDLSFNNSGFTMRYGTYDDSYRFGYISQKGLTLLKKSTTIKLLSGNIWQFWVDIDAGNILILVNGLNEPSYYNSPIIN